MKYQYVYNTNEAWNHAKWQELDMNNYILFYLYKMSQIGISPETM